MEWVRDLGIPAGASMKVRDVWGLVDAGGHVGSFTALVEPHDMVLLRLSPP